MPTHQKEFVLTCPQSLRTTSTGSEDCISVAKSWFYQFLESHPNCSVDDEDSEKLPTRLWHVESTEEGARISLCVTSELSVDDLEEGIH